MDNIVCPICGYEAKSKYVIKDKEDNKNTWYHCYCGSIYHNNPIDKSFFNQEYLDNLKDKKSIEERYDYLMRCYYHLVKYVLNPYGTKFIDIGFGLPYNIKKLQDDGWIATGIDIIPNDYITEDFEKFEFQDKFDFILMGNVLESLEDPIKGLEKTFDMLDINGVLLLTTHCPELFHKYGLLDYGHLSTTKDKKYLISRDQINKIAKRKGIKEQLYLRNESNVFTSWNNAHYIFQKTRI